MIEQFPEQLLGASVVERFGTRLPFLFKILSIRSPLSIQLHPNITQAKALHARDPKNYPDENHKPEISIALGDAPLLSGFRSQRELANLLKTVPELAALVGSDTTRDIEQLYRAVNLADPAQLSELCLKLYRRVQSSDSSIEEQWVRSIAELYPQGDVGVFSLFLLNLLERSTGDAVFSPAQNPHAYLGGNLVECMANSDNTIRAGLTPKFRDVETLLSVADYAARKPELLKATTDAANAPWQYYQTPAEEFVVSRIDGSHREIPIPETGGVQLIFCLSGSGSLATGDKALSPGRAYLIPATLKNVSISLEKASVFRISVPDSL